MNDPVTEALADILAKIQALDARVTQMHEDHKRTESEVKELLNGLRVLSDWPMEPDAKNQRLDFRSHMHGVFEVLP